MSTASYLPGDVRGTAVGVADIHLIPRTLILDIGYGTVNEATIQSYSQRGMNTDKHDYRLIEFGDTEYEGGRMTATFFDRRFEVYGAWYQGAMKLKSIRDKDGNVIVEAQDSPRQRGQNALFGTRLDLTDDYGGPPPGDPDRRDPLADAAAGLRAGLLRDGLQHDRLYPARQAEHLGVQFPALGRGRGPAGRNGPGKASNSSRD